MSDLRVGALRDNWTSSWYDVSLVDLTPGHATMAMPVLPCYAVTDGRSSRASTLLLTDVALALAVMSTTEQGTFGTTISLSVDHLADLPAGSALTMACSAAPARPGAPTQAHGKVLDEDGTLLATAAGWFLVHPIDPAMQPPPTAAPRPDAAGCRDLLEVVSATSTEVGPAGSRLSLDVLPRMWNHSSQLQGGLAGIASLMAAELAVGPEQQLLSSLISYERPAPGSGAVPVTADLLRKGRRTGLLETRVLNPDGRTALSGRVVTGATA